jgi:hypothetical protein
MVDAPSAEGPYLASPTLELPSVASPPSKGWSKEVKVNQDDGWMDR